MSRWLRQTDACCHGATAFDKRRRRFHFCL